MDQWWRPVSDIPVTEPRWVRMVEIRPTNLQARKILHHSIAYHILSPENTAAVNTGIGGRPVSVSGSTSAAQAAADLVNRRPQLMEWAIGKGYDRYLDGTGKLIMPGEKISWDQHIHAAGEEVTSSSELGIWDWDVASDRLYWSEGVEMLFGLPPGSFSGTYTDYIGLIYLLDRGSTLTRLELSLRDQTTVHIRHRVVWPDSSIHWLAWSGRIYRNADGVATRVLGIVHDTTGRMDE